MLSETEKAKQQLREAQEQLRREKEEYAKSTLALTNDLESTTNKLRLLKYDERKFRNIIENTTLGILEVDLNDVITEAHHNFCNLIGYTREELIGRSPRDVFLGKEYHPNIDRQHIDRLKGISSAYEVRLRKKNGDFIWVIINGVPLYDEQNNMFGSVGIHHDITGRKELLHQVLNNEKRLNDLIEYSPIGVVINDFDGTISRVNKKFCRLLGYTDQELLEKKIFEITYQEDAKKTHALIDDLLENRRKAFEVQKRYCRKDGSIIWCNTHVACVMNEYDQPLELVAMIEDITHKKKYEIELIEAKTLAENAQEMQRQFLANISHEIRTPLNVIIGMAHLLEDTELNVDQTELTNGLMSSSNLLLRLINDILDLRAIEAGHFELRSNVFNVQKLIDDLGKTFRVQLKDRPIEFKVNTTSEISRYLIGDDLVLSQVLHNLLGNAIKFTDKGSINLTLSCLKHDEQYCQLLMTVEDTGIGIPAAKLDIIFDQFKQIKMSMRPEKAGTGLGLSIAKKLVELQNGKIWVESKENVGSKFYVSLPYKISDIKIRPLNKNLVTQKDYSEKWVLIVEDNHMNIAYLSRLLAKLKLNVVIAFNGKEAVEKSRKQLFDIILMDIRMPEMDGLSATKIIRLERGLNFLTPIIALTASATVTEKKSSYEVGMTDFLSKPYTPTQLQGILERYLDHLPVRNSSSTYIYPGNQINDRFIEELYEGDTDHAREMISLFFRDVIPVFNRMCDAGGAMNNAEMTSEIHKIKTAFKMVGLEAIYEQILRLETLIKEDIDADIIVKTLTQIKQKLNLAIPKLQDFEKTLHGN